MMPLFKSRSKQAVPLNIKTEMAEGKPQKQAVAIALSEQRRAGRAMGGPASGQGFMVDPPSAPGQQPQGFPAPGNKHQPSPTDSLLSTLQPILPTGGFDTGGSVWPRAADYARPQLGANAAQTFHDGYKPGELQKISDILRFGPTSPADDIAHGFSQGTPEVPGMQGRDRGPQSDYNANKPVFAEGGSPRDLGLPDYLTKQAREGIPGADSSGFARGLIDTGENVGQLVSVPVEVARRGYQSVKEDLGNIGERSHAMAENYKNKSIGDLALEVGREGGPTAAMAATGPIGVGVKAGIPMVARAAEAYPRVAGALEGLFATGAGDLTSRAFASPAQAGEAQAAEGDIPRVMPKDHGAIQRVQEALKARGWQLTIDGNPQGITNKAFREYWDKEDARKAGESQRAIDLENTKGQNTAAEAKKTAEERALLETKNAGEAAKIAQSNKLAGDKRMKDINDNMPIWRQVLEGGAAPLGWLTGITTGILSRKGVAKYSNQFSQAKADKADAMLDAVKGGKTSLQKDLNAAGNLNNFARQGQTGSFPMFQRGEVPLPYDSRPDLVPPIKMNPVPPTQDQLYNPPRARQTATDLGIAGFYGLGEGGAAQWYYMPLYKQERDEALASLQKDPMNEGLIQQYYNARLKLAGAEAAARWGQLAGGSYLGASLKYPRNPAYPDIGKYEGKVNNLNDRLQTVYGSRALADLPPPREGGQLRADTTKALPGPDTGQVPAHKALEPPGGKTGSGTPGAEPQSGEPGGFPVYPPTTSSAEPPPPKPKTVAEATEELAANRRKARSEKAAAARKAKKQAPPESDESGGAFADGGEVSRHHSFYQPREQGRFHGGPVYPGSGDDSHNVQWPGYEPGGTVGQPGQHYWEKSHVTARRTGQDWGDYLSHEALWPIIEGIGQAASAWPAGYVRRGPTAQNFKNIEGGLLQKEPGPRIDEAVRDAGMARQKGMDAYDKGWSKMTQSGPDQAGSPKFDPGIFTKRPQMSPVYEGEMWDARQPVRYPDYNYQQWPNSKAKPGNDRTPLSEEPVKWQLDGPSDYDMALIEQKLRGLGETPKSQPIDPRTDPSFQKAIDFMDLVEHRSRNQPPPDLNVIPGGKAPPRGPFEPPPPEKAGGGATDFGYGGPPQMPSSMGGDMHGDGPPVGGPIMGEDPGRADTKPISVTSGSYVVPADVVSALGEGNTTAGMKKLTMTFPHQQGTGGQMGQPVPIKISDGEYVVTPDQVSRIGGGDLKQGHRLLDRIVQQVRAQHISNLKSMPPPAKS